MESDLSTEQIAAAFRKVLSEGEGPGGENRRAILIKRIPIICNDIMSIQTDIRWIKWLVMGMVGGIGMFALSLVLFMLTGNR